MEWTTNQLYPWFKGKPGVQYYSHIDLSLVNDCTGVAVVHKEGDIIIADLLMKIKAPKGKEIDLAEIRNIILELRSRKFDIAKCTYDQFQSASSIQELTKMGINSERLSVDKDLGPYETLKEQMYTGKFKMYHNPDLMQELCRLELVEGKKVDHPATVGSGKDVSDALAGAVFNCVSNESTFSFSSTAADIKKTEEQVLHEALTEPREGSDSGRGVYGYMRNRRDY